MDAAKLLYDSLSQAQVQQHLILPVLPEIKIICLWDVNGEIICD